MLSPFYFIWLVSTSTISLIIGSMDDLSVMSTQEITEVFRNYRTILKQTSFKTPLLRVSDLAKQRKSLHLQQMRQFQQEHIASLLPQGTHTQVSVDLMYLLAASSKQWRLRVPWTFLSKADCLSVIKTDKYGKVCVNKVKQGKVVRTFEKKFAVKAASFALGFPKFIHKCASSQLRLLFTLSDIEETWKNHILEVQQIQEFINPPHSSVSLTRVHWKQSCHRGIYYVLHHNSESPIQKTSHFRFKSIANLSKTVGESEKFVINTKAANIVSVKRTNPDPQLDCMAEEVATLLELSLCKSNERIEEIVCDFVYDGKGRPVLLSCKGYTFKAVKLPVARLKMQISKGEDSFVAGGEESVEEAKAVRSKSVISRRHSLMRPALPPVITLLKQPTPNPDFHCTQFYLTSITNSYDSLLSKLHTYKEDLKISINFVTKYGGPAFWSPILHTISGVFRADEKLKRYYDHLNFEEGSMLQRGYQRILEGNYNLYYKRSMTRVHMGKGIDVEAFHAFVENVGAALDGYPIEIEDIKTIIKRFRSFESCICPKN